MISIVTTILATLIVVGQLSLILLVVLLLAKSSWLKEKIGKKAMFCALIVASVAMLGSLFFSDIAGYEPCKLCWIQRIFMYPQALILLIALAEKDTRALVYSTALSSIGAVIAGYHYLLQIGIAPPLSCGTVGYSVSCAEKFVMNFGYITIPLMALTAFLMIFTFSIIGIAWNKNQQKI